MARTDNLTNFLNDVAGAIKTKKEYPSSQKIPAGNFDTEIASIDTVKGEQITVNPSTSQQVITPTQGKNAITQVTVRGVTSDIDNNITQNNIKKGVSILGVEGNLESDKPDQTKTVTPTTSQQIVEPDTGYELSSVTVNAVTSSIDSNIQAGNIKKDVTILGVTGTHEGDVIYNQNKVVSPTTSQQQITADEGYGYTGLGTVTIQGVDNTIDSNIIPANIKQGVEILGVTGTHAGGDISDATATAADILAGKTAYVNGGKVTGTLTMPMTPAEYAEANQLADDIMDSEQDFCIANLDLGINSLDKDLGEETTLKIELPDIGINYNDLVRLVNFQSRPKNHSSDWETSNVQGHIENEYISIISNKYVYEFKLEFYNYDDAYEYRLVLNFLKDQYYSNNIININIIKPDKATVKVPIQDMSSNPFYDVSSSDIQVLNSLGESVDFELITSFGKEEIVFKTDKDCDITVTYDEKEYSTEALNIAETMSNNIYIIYSSPIQINMYNFHVERNITSDYVDNFPYARVNLFVQGIINEIKSLNSEACVEFNHLSNEEISGENASLGIHGYTITSTSSSPVYPGPYLQTTSILRPTLQTGENRLCFAVHNPDGSPMDDIDLSECEIHYAAANDDTYSSIGAATLQKDGNLLGGTYNYSELPEGTAYLVLETGGTKYEWNRYILEIKPEGGFSEFAMVVELKEEVTE